jgi:hypothetical protein
VGFEATAETDLTETPDQATEVKFPMATKIELRSMAELRVMSPEERLKYGKALVTVKDAAKDATEAHKDSFKAAGKYLCILEEKLVEAKLARLEPANTDLKTYFKRFIGVDGNISGHAYTLKDAYGVYVTSGLLTEEHFDKASANALESAHKVYVAVVEKGSGLTDASVQKAAALLRDRADGYAKVLTELAKSLKAPKRIAESDIVAFLTSAFAEDTGHLVIVARELGASIAAVRKTSAEWLRQGVFCHLAVAAQSCGTPDEIAKWMKGGPGVPTQPTPTEKPTNAKRDGSRRVTLAIPDGRGLDAHRRNARHPHRGSGPGNRPDALPRAFGRRLSGPRGGRERVPNRHRQGTRNRGGTRRLLERRESRSRVIPKSDV